METRGIPKERDQAVYRGVIDSREKFLTYVSMVLSSGEDLEGVGLEQESTRQRGEGTDAESAQGPAIYEAIDVYKRQVLAWCTTHWASGPSEQAVLPAV